MRGVTDLSEEIARAFGEKLTAARAKAGLTQEELGHRCGINRAHIGELERGNVDIRLSSLVRVAGALGLTPCDLMPNLRWDPPGPGQLVVGSS